LYFCCETVESCGLIVFWLYFIEDFDFEIALLLQKQEWGTIKFYKVFIFNDVDKDLFVLCRYSNKKTRAKSRSRI